MATNDDETKIVIEIGANNGKDTENLLNIFPNAVIYAFEPTHELLTKNLWPKFKNNERVKIIPFAVDIESTFKTFNIAGQSDWGCSSLHKFSDDIEKNWPNRPDFKITHTYTVPTITMYDFCSVYKIDSVDYLWIDTQGNDLNCLRSFGSKIDIVKHGRCEAAGRTELYQNTGNTYENCKNWLLKNNFDVESPPPDADHEIDMHFSSAKLRKEQQ